jgi:hypothetical protein
MRIYHRIALLSLLFLASLIIGFARNDAAPVSAQAPQPRPIGDFQLISPGEGWLLYDNRLYWRTIGSQAWTDMTPAAAGSSDIRAAFFVDHSRGWLILSDRGSAGSGAYRLARTVDGGTTWTLKSLALFSPGDEAAIASAVHLSFVDAQRGWLVFKRATGSSFSAGTLFATADGGETWEQRSLPIGEPVYFVDERLGWTVGGTGDDKLYRTSDGGRSWTPQRLSGLTPEADRQIVYRLPVFDGSRSGVLPVVVKTSTKSAVALYVTSDGGASWQLKSEATRLKLGPGAEPSIAAFDADNWTVVDPASDFVFRVSASRESLSAIKDNPAVVSGIVEVRMPTPTLGWARAVSGQCAAKSPSIDGLVCTSSTQLLQTVDGGLSWTPLALPDGQSAVVKTFIPLKTSTPAIASLGSRTGSFVGQGFDSCTLPSAAQMQTWYNSSPYRVWNLYIGGSSRAACGTLTASFLSQLAQQGWRFIPTWVGPQAACSSLGTTKMSFDPATAFNQGVTEANSAVARATSLGLAESDGSGTILYYDLEAYNTNDSACRAAASSFISGWSGQLRARNNQAGVYGSACSSALSDFAGVSNVPDVVWIAAWMVPYQYRSDATVWNVSCLSNTLWTNQQRLRQYAGGHNETWGEVTINIDSDVIDGPVANLGSNLCSPSADQIALYLDTNFGGQCVVKGIGDYASPGAIGLTNDAISSVRVGANVKAILCMHDNFDGTCDEFQGDDPNLGDNPIGDNQVSSARVDSRYPVTLYGDPNYAGNWCALLVAGWSNVCPGFDNLASAIRIQPGWSARVWQNAEQGGASRCFTANVSNFSGLQFNENGNGNLDNTVSTFAAYNQSSCPPLTTNVAPNASVMVSTQINATFAGARAIDNVIGQHNTGEWASAGELNPWIQLTWGSAQTVDRIRLYDRPNLTDTANSGTLTFSDGSSIAVSGIPNDGSVKEITFAARSVTWVRFQVQGGAGINVGLSEFQVFLSGGPAPTATNTPLATMTRTPTATPTVTHTPTVTNTPLFTPTRTPTPSPTRTSTAINTATHTPTSTATRTPPPTSTPTQSPSGVNVAPNASVMVSSQINAAYAGIRAIDNIIGQHNNGEWASAGELNPWIQLTWGGPQTIDRVRLFDRPNLTDAANGGILTFSDGSSVAVSAIPNDGTVREITFSARAVTWVRFQVQGGAGINVGLSEFQVFTSGGPAPTATSTPLVTNTPTAAITFTPTVTPTQSPSGVNVAPNASVTVSSQINAAYAGTKTIDNIIGQHNTGEWASTGELNPWVQLTWGGPQTIDRVRLFDRPNLTDAANGGILTFSDGSSVAVSAIPNNGTVREITFAARAVTWVRFQVQGGAGVNVGLSEFQVWTGP